MGIHERELRSGHRLRQECPLPPRNGESNLPHPSPRVWRPRIPGALTGAAATCLVQGFGHPGIRDPRRNRDCRKGATHCKHGRSGVGDRFCTPIQGKLRMLGLERGLPPGHSDALCAAGPQVRNGPSPPALSPSEGERGNRRQLPLVNCGSNSRTGLGAEG